jgi:hypothetical protein
MLSINEFEHPSKADANGDGEINLEEFYPNVSEDTDDMLVGGEGIRQE